MSAFDPTTGLKNGMATFLSSEKYSDLQIKTGGTWRNVHKLVLCAQSDFFDKACSERFKEGIEARIDLEEDPPDAVAAMLSFLYLFDYKIPEQQESMDLQFHAKVYVIAEKYDISCLKEHAFQQIRSKNSSYRLLQNEQIHDFISMIEITYNGTPEADRTLRDFVCQWAKKNITSLAMQKEFEDLLESGGNFAKELVRTLGNVPTGGDRYSKKGVSSYCRSCGTNLR